jgi:hypothetical protein
MTNRVQVSKVTGSENSRNISVVVKGTLTERLTLQSIDIPVRNAKLASLVWVIQEKMGIYLWETKEHVLLPMESRNSIRFDHSIVLPDDKLWISSFNNDLISNITPKSFFLILDMDR